MRTSPQSFVDRFVAKLMATPGEFVAGRLLAEELDLDVNSLGRFAALARARGLDVEGKNGQGYRIVTPGAPRQMLPPPAKRAAWSCGLGQRQTMRLQLLDLLPPEAARRCKEAALDSGELVEDTLDRLIEWGFAEHCARVAAGINPLQFRRAA